MIIPLSFFAISFFCHHLPFEEQHIHLYFNLGMCSEATITTRRAQGKKFAIGTILSLRCRCPSSSPGTTRWIKNGVTVSATNGRITVDQRKLNINSTSFADSGNYTCYVTVPEHGTAKSETVEIWGKRTNMHGTCIKLLWYRGSRARARMKGGAFSSASLRSPIEMDSFLGG